MSAAEAAPPGRSRFAWEAPLLVLLKLGVSGGVIASGFLALSDDDFARVTIAQRFAVAPSLDPSGTSWLPLPFMVQGGLARLFGSSFEVARWIWVTLGALSLLLVRRAGLWLGLTRASAWWAAAAAALLPVSAWLGAAALPELTTASLCVAGIAAAQRPELGIRALGALALLAATLCRYETWPVAAGFAALTLLDALRSRQPWLVSCALLALSGGAGWMLHGLLHHHDALFFLTRVAEYRRALGGAGPSWLQRLTAYPRTLVLAEPELCAVTAVGLLLWARARAGQRRADLRRAARPLLLGGALVLFLVMGDLRDGAPTHHAERALLVPWMLLGLLSAGCWWSTLGQLGQAWPRLAALGAGLIALVALGLRPHLPPRDGFAERHAELWLGQEARRRLPDDAQLLIETGDYGYFAVQAGYARPGRSQPLATHDPRHAGAAALAPPPEGLAALLRARAASAAVVPRAWSTAPSPSAPWLWAETQRLVLVGPAPSDAPASAPRP